MDSFFDLLLVLVVIAVVVTVIVLPVVILVIALISRRRLSRLEARLARLEATLAGRAVFPTVAEARPEPLANPDYKPEPKPLTERVPWLIYLVLAASSIALGYVLFGLARTTTRMKVQQPD